MPFGDTGTLFESKLAHRARLFLAWLHGRCWACLQREARYSKQVLGMGPIRERADLAPRRTALRPTANMESMGLMHSMRSLRVHRQHGPSVAMWRRTSGTTRRAEKEEQARSSVLG